MEKKIKKKRNGRRRKRKRKRGGKKKGITIKLLPITSMAALRKSSSFDWKERLEKKQSNLFPVDCGARYPHWQTLNICEMDVSNLETV